MASNAPATGALFTRSLQGTEGPVRSLVTQEHLQGSSESLKSLGVLGGDLLWVSLCEGDSLAAAVSPSASSSAVPKAPAADSSPFRDPDGGCLKGASEDGSASHQAQPPYLPQDEAAPALEEDLQLVEHSKLLFPDYLQRVLQACSPPSQAAEALVLLAHAALLESGLQLRATVCRQAVWLSAYDDMQAQMLTVDVCVLIIVVEFVVCVLQLAEGIRCLLLGFT